MATPTPITWKNVPGGGSSSSVDVAVQPYGILNSGLTSGFAQLSNVLNQYKKGEMGAAQDALMAQLGQYTTPEQMAQAQASGAITGAVNNRWVDAADATRAIESRLSGLQTQARSAQEYSDFTDAVAARPHFEAISQLGAAGDIEGVLAYGENHKDVRGIGSHMSKVLNSIYDTQKNQANINTLNAQAAQADMTTAVMQQTLDDQKHADELVRYVDNENTRLRTNRELLNNTSKKLEEHYGVHTVLDENGLVDLPATQANMEQAVKDNALAYSLANVNQTNYNNMRNGIDDSERAKQAIQEFNNPNSFQDITPVALQDHMSGEIPATELLNHRLRNTDPTDTTPRSLPEWPGQIPELIEHRPLDQSTSDLYSHLYNIAGYGTDTEATQALRSRLLRESEIRPSVIDSTLSNIELSSAPSTLAGQDDIDHRTQTALTRATEDEILAGNQSEMVDRFMKATNENGYLKGARDKTKVVNEAMKLANKERTVTTPEGEEVTYFLTDEIVETVIKTTRGKWYIPGRDWEFSIALKNWETVNMPLIIGGSFAREEVLKQRNLERNLRELGVSSSGN